MKTIMLLTATVAVFSSILCVGCERLKSLADMELNTSYIVDTPVNLVSSDMQSSTFRMSLTDIEDLSEYMDKLQDLYVEDIEVSVLNYKGDDFSGDLSLMVDGEPLWSRAGVTPENLGTISLRDEATLNAEALTALGLKLLNGDRVEGRLLVETNSEDPVTASFTVRCKFIMDITANPL